MLRTLVSICVGLNAFVQAPLPTDKPVAKASRQLYEQAAQAIASADARSAIEPLEKLIGDSSSPLANIAAVHLAECYISVDRAEDAIKLSKTWSPRIEAKFDKSTADSELYLHHLRVWMQAAKRLASDEAAIQELRGLVETAASGIAKDNAQVTELLIAVRFELARQLVAAGQLSDAAKQLELVTATDNEAFNAEAYLLHAVVLQQMQEHASARRLFQRLSEFPSPSIGRSLARLELANYALQESDPVLAEQYLRPLIDAQITKTAAPGSANEPRFDASTECRLRMLWSESELVQGNAKEAFKALPSEASISVLGDAQQIAVRFSRAEAASRAGELQVASSDLQWLDAYARRQQVEPTWAATVALRQCELLLKTKQYATLEKSVAESKHRFADFERLHEFDYLLARAAVLQVDFDAARMHLQSIMDATHANQNSAFARATWMLGETYFMEQKFDEAIVEYKRVADGALPQPWPALSLMQMAKCYELQSRTEEAVAMYQRAIEATKDPKIQQEAAARVDVIQRTAAQEKKPKLR